MKKLLHNKLIFVILIMIAVVVFVNIRSLHNKETMVTKANDIKAPVTAGAACPDYEEDELAAEELLGRYNAEHQYSADGQYIVFSINPKDADDDITEKLAAATFELVEVSENDVSDKGLTMKKGSPLTVKVSDLVSWSGGSQEEVAVLFQSTEVDVDVCTGFVWLGWTIDNPSATTVENAIYVPNETFYVDNSSDAGYADGDDNGGADVYVDDNNYSSLNEVNCNKPASQYSAFEASYCSLASSINTGVSQGQTKTYTVGNNLIVNYNDVLKCDVTKVNNKSTSSTEYFSNVSTMRAKKTFTKTLENHYYLYRFAPGNYYVDDSANNFKCKVTCEENIEVKYGPPVAIKAGFCFEYEVQAISHVKCTSTPKVKKPVQKTGYCDPIPQCVHSNGKVKVRAGPDEEFDDCVESCDGGKYTERCSDSCYKKVYLQTNEEMMNYEDKYYYSQKIVTQDLQTQINECMGITSGYKYKLNNYKKEKENYYGCYYMDGSTPKWNPDEPDAPARWYRDEDPNRNYSRYTVVGGGFIRLKYSGAKKKKYGDYCHAACHYELRGCTQNLTGSRSTRLASKYLNPGVAKADNKRNTDEYNAAVTECKAKSTCSTTETTFKITVDEKGSNITDVLTYAENGKINNGGKSYDEVLAGAKTLREFNGCFKNGDSTNIWYKARWGFSGACIDSKTFSITNSVNGCQTGQKTYSNKYCLPFDAKKVNEKWWRWYYTMVDKTTYDAHGEVEDTDSTKSAAFNEKCNCDWQVNSIDNYEPNYNIVATASQFGYFKWNLNIQCFYAYGETCKNKSCDSDGGSSKRTIRTVDLRNLFPDGNGGNITSSEQVGRNPGFNWTKYATNAKKNINYKSFPIEYVKWIQKKGYNIYSDDNLDYQVVLTKQMIRNIKNTTRTSDFKYTNYNGDVIDNNVINYKSNLLRRTLANYTLYPNDTALQCNNMKNYRETECEDFKE